MMTRFELFIDDSGEWRYEHPEDLHIFPGMEVNLYSCLGDWGRLEVEDVTMSFDTASGKPIKIVSIYTIYEKRIELEAKILDEVEFEKLRKAGWVYSEY